jgi:hypothetical protein
MRASGDSHEMLPKFGQTGLAMTGIVKHISE